MPFRKQVRFRSASKQRGPRTWPQLGEHRPWTLALEPTGPKRQDLSAHAQGPVKREYRFCAQASLHHEVVG
eukprot:1158948-Pelagomonas_calceolata.AAC.3